MAHRGDNGGIRAGIAALVAVGVLTGFVLWLGVDTALRAKAEQARDAGERVDAQLLARRIESSDVSETTTELEFIVDEKGGIIAAGVYDSSGSRTEFVTEGSPDRIETLAPPDLRGDEHAATGAAAPVSNEIPIGKQLIELRDGRSLLVVHERRPVMPWADSLLAYQALTLGVIVAAIAFLFWRLRRHSPGTRREALTTTSVGDGPAREADFVVETFQSVIGELQHKGKQLELRSQLDRERADRSERFAERLIAQMPTGLVVIDRTGCITAANPSARELFAGLPSGRTESVRQIAVFETAPGLSPLIADCLASGQSFQRREIELRTRTADGATRCLGVSVSPIGPAGGPVEAALALMTDLTEVVALRDRVRVQETLASLGEMAAGLTHELKNSLATIQGYAQLLAGIDARATEPSDALMTEVRMLSQMVTDFLNFAKPQDLALAPVRLVDVVESVVDRLGDRLATDEIVTTVNDETGNPPAFVRADEMLLSRAILNLVQNAIEAIEGIDGPRRIDLSMRRSDPNEMLLEIRDNGPGIPLEDLARIFIPFFTTRSRGYGIGLALTQKIILAHGGRITVENGNPGAVFRCHLPATATDSESD